MSLPRFRALSFALAAVTAGTLAACSGATPPVAAPTTGAAASATQQAARASAPVSDPIALERMALHTGDLPRGSSVSLAPGGASVAGEVTLDNCGYDFTSEVYRVARRQYTVTDTAAEHIRIGNEVVAYSTALEARFAFREWKLAARTCPSGYSRSDVQGEPPMREKVLHHQTQVPGLPAHLSMLTGESASPQHGHELWEVVALQVQRHFLDAVYLSTPSAPTAADYRLAISLAHTTGERLAHT